MRTPILLGLAAIGVAACAAPRPVLESTEPSSSAQLVAEIESDAERSEHEQDSGARVALAAAANQAAEACLRREPQGAACHFGRAIALGLEAREHPLHASAILNDMLETLARADAIDPNYAHAGPSRVRALVLLRAPAWPLGPGDPDAGLAAALHAVALSPAYPPNLLAVAEAWGKKGSAGDARASYQRAREAALALPAAADRDEWVREADEGMRRR